MYVRGRSKVGIAKDTEINKSSTGCAALAAARIDHARTATATDRSSRRARQRAAARAARVRTARRRCRPPWPLPQRRNPKANRDGYRAGASTSLKLCQRVLTSSEGRSALQHVTELFDGGTVALMCFERSHDDCHRHQVVEELDVRQVDRQLRHCLGEIPRSSPDY